MVTEKPVGQYAAKIQGHPRSSLQPMIIVVHALRRLAAELVLLVAKGGEVRSLLLFLASANQKRKDAEAEYVDAGRLALAMGVLLLCGHGFEVGCEGVLAKSVHFTLFLDLRRA